MSDLGGKLCELLQELSMKRGECQELNQRYQEEVMNKEVLKTQIESLKTDMDNLNTQLEFTNKLYQKCEENFGRARESSVKHKLGLDTSNRTVDAMKDQVVKFQTENVKLKKQADDMERDMKAEMYFRESCVSKQTKTQKTMEKLAEQIRNLERDSREVERHANEALSGGNKSKLMLEHKDAIIDQLKKKNADLSAQVVVLTSENRNLQESLKEKKPVEQHYVKEILQEWQNSVAEIKRRTSSYEEETATLHKALQNALDIQTKFQKLEADSSDRVKMLEEKLRDTKKALEKSKTDCSVQTDLNISLDVACETEDTRPEVGHKTTQTDTEIEFQKLQDSNHISSRTPRLTQSSLQQFMLKFHSGLEDSSRPEPETASQALCDPNDIPTQVNSNLPQRNNQE